MFKRSRMRMVMDNVMESLGTCSIARMDVSFFDQGLFTVSHR